MTQHGLRDRGPITTCHIDLDVGSVFLSVLPDQSEGDVSSVTPCHVLDSEGVDSSRVSCSGGLFYVVAVLHLEMVYVFKSVENETAKMLDFNGFWRIGEIYCQ